MTKYADLYIKVKKHLNTDNQTMIENFIAESVEEMIRYTSQEKPEDQLCPFCYGNGHRLNEEQDHYGACPYCNTTGFIKKEKNK